MESERETRRRRIDVELEAAVLRRFEQRRAAILAKAFRGELVQQRREP